MAAWEEEGGENKSSREEDVFLLLPLPPLLEQDDVFPPLSFRGRRGDKKKGEEDSFFLFLPTPSRDTKAQPPPLTARVELRTIVV